MAKKDVNRLKIMLAVTKHSNKWLAEMLGKDQATISNGAPTLANQTWKP